jgi:hypothetical protein
MNQFPPSPRVSHWDRFEFFRKFAEIFASKGAPPVSTTPAANFATSFASVVDTGGKFATGVSDTGDTGLASLHYINTPKLALLHQ